MTPNQQKKVVKMLGANKIEEITGKPVPENLAGAARATTAAPPRPTNIPVDAQWSPSKRQFRDRATGKLYDANGTPL